MSDFFASIYEFLGVYSTDLAEHLRGYDLACQDYIGTNYYVLCGIWMIVLSLIFMILYYYVFSRPALAKVIYWLLFMLVNAIINYLIAFGYSYNDLATGSYCGELSFSIVDCSGFGLMNAIWSAIAFFLFSLIGKWGSNDCRKIPF